MNDPSSVAVSVPQIVLTDFPGPELTGKVTIFIMGMEILCPLVQGYSTQVDVTRRLLDQV